MSDESSVEQPELNASTPHIRELAAEIRKLAKTTGFDRRLVIGELVWKRFFADRVSEGELTTRGPQLTLRRLCKALQGTISKSDLHRCINTLLVCQALPFVPASGHLTVGHVDAVAGLPRPLQASLLQSAEANEWSCRQLRQARRNVAREAITSARRPSAARASVAMPSVSRMTRQLDRLSLSLREGNHPDVDGQDLLQLVQCLAAVREACDNLRSAAATEPVPERSSSH